MFTEYSHIIIQKQKENVMKGTMEKTLVIFKPDAIQRGLVGEILSRLEKKGLKLVSSLKMIRLTDEILAEHYAHHYHKEFFTELKQSMQRSPVFVGVIEGYRAIGVVRYMVGVTNSCNASPGTIRGDLSLSRQNNLIHASDSSESADAEIARFFSADEIFSYDLVHDGYLYSQDERGN